MKMNKRGQIPSTLTWIIAFVIIMFFLVIFNLATAGLAVKKSVNVAGSLPIQSDKEIRSSYKIGELEVYNRLSGFLNSEVEHNGIMTRVYDMISSFQLGDEIFIRELGEGGGNYFFRENGISSWGVSLFFNNQIVGKFGNLACESEESVKVSRIISDKRLVFCALSDGKGGISLK